MRTLFSCTLVGIVYASSASWTFDDMRLSNGGDPARIGGQIDGQLSVPFIGIRFVSPAAAAIVGNQTSAALNLDHLDQFEIDTIAGDTVLAFHRSYRTRQYLVQPDASLICAIPAISNPPEDNNLLNRIVSVRFTTERNWEPHPGLPSRGVLRIGNSFGSNFLMIPSADGGHPNIHLYTNNLNEYCSHSPAYVDVSQDEGFVVRLTASIDADHQFDQNQPRGFHSYSIQAVVRIASSVDYIPRESFTRIVRHVDDHHAGTYARAIRSRDYLRGGTEFRNCNITSFPTIVYNVQSNTQGSGGPSSTNLVLYPEDYVELTQRGNCIARILPATTRTHNSFVPRGTIGLNVFKNVAGIFEPGNRIGFCDPL